MAYQLTDDDMLEVQARARQMQAAQSTAQPKSAGMLGDILSTVGGIGGGLLGIPFGGVGAIAGGAGGSALGRGLANMITGTDLGNGVAQDAVLGGAGGVLGKFMKIGGVGSKAVSNATAKAGSTAIGAAPKTGLLARFGETLTGSGNKLMASQANLTRAQARNLSEPIADTFGKLQNRTGIGNMDSLMEVGGKVTGKNGIVSNEVKRSLSPVSVDISDLRKVTDDALIDLAPGVQGQARKGITENIKNNVVKAYGGSKGSLSSVVGGEDAFKVVQGFEKQASTYANAFKRAGNVTDDQTAKVYRSLADNIKEKLYKAPGAEDSFLRSAKPRILSEMNAEAVELAADGNKAGANALRRLAKEFDGVTNIKDARTFQKDFVQLGGIAEKTGQAEMGAAMQLGGNNMQGLGRFAQNPLNIAAAPLNAQSGRVGALIARAGQKLSGQGAGATAEVTGKLTKKDLIKSLVAQGVPRAALGGMAGDPAAAISDETLQMMTADPSLFTPEQLAAAGLGDGASLTDSYGSDGIFGKRTNADGTESGLSKESLDNAIIEAASRGDEKSVGMLMNLGEYFYGGKSAELSAAGQKSMQSMSAAGQTVDNLEAILSQAGGQDNGVLANIFGGARAVAGKAGVDETARLYESQAGAAATQLARAISGETGAMTEGDIQRAKDMIPKLGDSNAVRAQKISIIRAAIQNNQKAVSQYGGGGAGDSTSLAAMFGGM